MTRLARSIPGYTAFGSLEPGQVASDIQVNRWQMQAGSITGKLIAPQSITTEKIQVGAVGGTVIMDGAIQTQHIAAYSIVGDRIALHTIEGDNIKAGTITAEQIASGTITAGILTVDNLADIATLYAGSFTISSSEDGSEPISGVYIDEDVFRMTQAGEARVEFDTVSQIYFFSGQVVTDNLTVNASSDNSVDLTLGTHYFGDGIVIGATPRTLGDLARVFTQADEPNPAEVRTGDLWIETDNADTLYIWDGAAWQLYTEPGAGSGATALQPNTFVEVDENNCITAIDTTGITISTTFEPAVARVLINWSGVGVYDADAFLKTFMAVDGLGICNAHGSLPELQERISFYEEFGGQENGRIYYDSDNHQLVMTTLPTESNVGRIKFWDGRQYGDSPIVVPFIDYGIRALTTGTRYNNYEAVTWEGGTHASAPTFAIPVVVNDENNGARFVNLAVRSTSASGAVLSWMTVDGSIQVSDTDIIAVGIWL